MPTPRRSGSLSLTSASAFRRYFWQPPRAHGDVIEGREVSFLELFYDLVYVVVVSQAARHLAGGVTWGSLGQFTFLQMGLLTLLAVFTTGATAGDGATFALVYSAYLFLLGWLWYSVRRQDDAAYRPRTTPYIAGVLISAAVVAFSALMPQSYRIGAWAVVVVGWLIGLTALDGRRGGITSYTSANASESMIERFDLLTIIVLGEVVVGVVNGIADAHRTPIAVVTGILGLGIGFAYWWSYFDLVAARPVRPVRGALSRWLIGHLAVTMTIAATGGVMVSMLEHTSSGHAPAPAPMVLSVSVATGAVALVLVATSLADWGELPAVYRPVSVALVVAAAVALVIGWLAPPPWLQILLLTLVLGVVWLYGILTWFGVTHHGQAASPDQARSPGPGPAP